MKHRNLIISTLALILMSACSDSTGVEVDDLAGVWTATSLVFTSVADPTISVDLVVVEQATVTLTLRSEATYALVITSLLEPTENEAGTYVVTGTTLTLSQTGTGSPEPFTIVRNGDTMTLTDIDEEFDFSDDQVGEPAIMVITLTR